MLAQRAAKHAQLIFIATNQPYIPALNNVLERERTRLNKVELKKFYDVLKQKRESLPVDSNANRFEQETYRKGTGTNIRMWSQHGMNRTGGNRKVKLGNCTEQCNAAFDFIYRDVYDLARNDNQGIKGSPPIDRVERIDVDNLDGGHVFLIIDRKPGDFPKQAEEFAKDGLPMGKFAVVVDPWNKSNPFYPAADLPSKLPTCSRNGPCNIEFGHAFSFERPNDLTPRIRSRL